MINDSMHLKYIGNPLYKGSKIGTEFKTWFFLVPAFKLAVLESYPLLDKMFIMWAALSLAVLVVIGVRNSRKEKKALQYALLMFVFCALYSYRTKVYTSEAFLGSVSQSIRMLLFPFYILTYRNANFKELLNSMSKYFKLILFLDSITIFIDYDGKVQYSLLGLDNTVIFLIIPLLAIIIFNDHYRYERVSRSSIILFIVCFVGKLYSQAVTACLAMLVFAMAYYAVLCRNRNPYIIKIIDSIFNPTVMFAVYVIFTAVTLLIDLTPLFSNVFSLLGKSGTLSSRKRIWLLSVWAIIRNPILGYGQACPNYFQNIVGLSVWDKAANHTHNYVLELLWATGIVGTSIYMYLFIKAIKILHEHRDLKPARLLSCGFTAFCILMITDSYIMQPAIMMLCFLCLNYEKVINSKSR